MSAVVRILPSGREFVVQAGEPLLEAALRNGLALEFGCTTGSCGECRGRVTRGRVRRIRYHDYVIRESDKRAGWILLCCCTADGDVSIEAGEAGGPDDIPVQNVRARLYGQELIAGSVAVVRLRVMRGQMLRFLAGQYVRLKRAGGESADISIASCPCDGLNLEFHFQRRHGDDMSARAMAGFAKSDRFQIQGPRGRFTLDESSRRPLAFFAQDTAIAPIKSIVEHAINLELPQPVRLFWQCSEGTGHYLHNYFRSLADALDDLRYLPGDIHVDSLRELADPSAVDAYVAGDETFVAAVSELLLDRGLAPERLFIDALNRRPASAPRAD